LGTILRSTDGGLSWDMQSSPTSSNLYGLSVGDAQRALAVGCQVAPDLSCQSRATILRTTDGGISWVDISGLHRRPLYAVSFFNANIGTAVGGNEIILRTTDGGDHWTSMPWRKIFRGWFRERPLSGVGVSFGDPDIGFAVGTNQDGSPALMRTRDGGVSWTVWRPGDPGFPWIGGPEYMLAVSFLDANTGWIGGADFAPSDRSARPAVVTTDGGATWSGPLMQHPIGGENAYVILALSVVGTDSVWAVGYILELITRNIQPLVARTDGASWTVRDESTRCYAIAADCAYFAVSFVDANTGWIANKTDIEHTADSGGVWTRQFSLPGAGLRGLSFVDINYGWAVGAGGQVFRTTDGGGSWALQPSGTPNDLYAITALDASTATAVGASGAIVRTTDGGTNWTLQPSGTTDALLAVSFVDADTGWIVGDGSTLHTITGGE